MLLSEGPPSATEVALLARSPGQAGDRRRQEGPDEVVTVGVFRRDLDQGVVVEAQEDDDGIRAEPC